MPIGARAAVTLDLLILQVDDPNLRDAVAGVEGEFDVPVFFEASVGNFYNNNRLFSCWVGTLKDEVLDIELPLAEVFE